MTEPTIVTNLLGKRFRMFPALVDCTVEVPEGRVSGLVGANGAGKTTLMRLLAGMSRPTSGSAMVAGRQPSDESAFLREVGYLAQQVPLYGHWTVADHLDFGAHMNPRWDGEYARDRLVRLRIPMERRIDALSGGMHAQVGLALALGKRPRVLLLDEPLASLDPLARREFMGSLAAAVADGGLTVLLSSHLLGDLERICDHLVVMSGGRALLCDDIEDVVASHKRLVGSGSPATIEHQHTVLARARSARETELIVRLDGSVHEPAWRIEDLSLEDIVLAYLGLTDAAEPRAGALEVTR